MTKKKIVIIEIVSSNIERIAQKLLVFIIFFNTNEIDQREED
jgi:hypothetical protein